MTQACRVADGRRALDVPGWSRCDYPPCAATRSAEPGTITGTARLDRRTKRLVGRLRPGDIAVIDHVDLDRVAADSLVAVGVAAVLNAKPSISGRYPNLGPEVLVKAGIPLVDDLGEERVRAAPRGRHGPRSRATPSSSAASRSPRRAAGRRDRRQGDGRRPRGPVGAAGGVRRQHDGVSQAGARPAARRRRRARGRRPRSPAGTA